MKTICDKRKGCEEVVRELRKEGRKLKDIAETLSITIPMIQRILKTVAEIKTLRDKILVILY